MHRSPRKAARKGVGDKTKPFVIVTDPFILEICGTAMTPTPLIDFYSAPSSSQRNIKLAPPVGESATLTSPPCQ